MKILPIKSKHLQFFYIEEDNEVHVFNKKSDDILAIIYKPKKSRNYWWFMKKDIHFDLRCTQDICKAINYLKEQSNNNQRRI